MGFGWTVGRLDRLIWGASGIAMIQSSPNKFLTLLAVAVASRMGSPAVAETPERVETLGVYGEDPCPQEHDGAIVVCARKPESERYRIPKELRKKKEVAGSQGWGSRVETMESVNRQLLPNSCSAIGSNGQTG